MKSGISQRILYSIGLFQAGSSNPVSAIVRFCSITYDLWDEKYSVICESPGKKLKTTLKKDKQLLYFISSFSRFKIGLKNFIKSDKEYYVKTTVQLNPVSPKLLRKVRAWLRQSDQSSYTTNYLGSFLSLFVSKNIGGNDLEFNFKTPAMKGILIK
ncbi:MAG: hypothetical protein JXR95_07480 [Deltaproteobacteria bacterium]|nr:hypothetical protein [Deltaproteobacteria bacterium]